MDKIQDTMKKYEMESWNSYRLIAIACKFEVKEEAVSQEERDTVNKEILVNLPDSVKEAFFVSPVLYEHMALLS